MKILTLCAIGIFFFNDTATTEIYTLSLHDALPIWPLARAIQNWKSCASAQAQLPSRSEEHTSELQSPYELVCRLLLEKKKNSHGARGPGTDERNICRPRLDHTVHGRRDVCDTPPPAGGSVLLFLFVNRRPPRFVLFPYTTLFR